jgi:fibronectin-binding autotransporter adhesin
LTPVDIVWFPLVEGDMRTRCVTAENAVSRHPAKGRWRRRAMLALAASPVAMLFSPHTAHAQDDLIWTGAGNGTTWDIGITPNWFDSNNGSNDFFANGDNVTFNDTNNNDDYSINIAAGGVDPGSVTVDTSSVYTFSGGPITASGNLDVTGGGTLVLENSNTYSGIIDIDFNSVLQFGNNNATGEVNTVNITDNGALVLDRSDNFSFANNISGSGSFEQLGTGIVKITGKNGYTGATIIQHGTIEITSNDSLGSISANPGPVEISNNGTLDVGGDPEFNDLYMPNQQVYISGMGVGGEGAIVDNEEPQFNPFLHVTLTGNAAIGGTQRWNLYAADQINPTLNLAGFTLDKVGVNQISVVYGLLENTSSTPAFVDVQNGLFSLEESTFTSGSGSIKFENGVNAQFYNLFGDVAWPMTFAGNNIIGNNSPGVSTVPSNMTLNGSVTLEPLNGVNGGSPSNNYPLAITGNISGVGALNVNGATTVNLSGSNSWSGGTNIQMGVLQLGSNTALPSGTNLTFGDSGGDAGTLDLAGFNTTVGGLSVVSPGSGLIGSSASTNSTLTYAGGTNSSTFSGTIEDSISGGTGSLSLVVSSGTLKLSGSSSIYSGGTTINGGELIVANGANSATGVGNVTMNGGVLASSVTGGSISGNVISGSGAHTIAPGGLGTIGTLDIGGLTSTSLTTLNFDLGSGSGEITNGDLLMLGSGTINLGAGTKINFGVDPTTVGDDYRLIGGDISGINLGNFNLPSAPGSLAYELNSSVDPGYIDLMVITIPTLTWNNAGGTGDGVTWDISNNQNWSNSGTPFTYADPDHVIFNDVNNGNYQVNITPGGVQPGSVVVNTTGTYTFSGGGIGGNTGISLSGGGTLILANSNSYSGVTDIEGGSLLQIGAGSTTGFIPSATVTDNGTFAFDRSDNITVGINVTGTGSFGQLGPGIMTVTGTNNYSGATIIQNGTLVVTGNHSLGNGNGPVEISNGGTLDLGGDPFGNDLDFGNQVFDISGQGVGGEGAIVNNSGLGQYLAIGTVVLTGDAAIGGSVRWDIRNNNISLNIAGFTLDKVGTNQISLTNASLESTNAGTGVIDVKSGILSIEQFTTTYGTATIVYENGVNAQFYNQVNPITWPMVMQGNNLMGNESPGLSTIESAITLNGPVTLEPLNGFNAPPTGNNYPLTLTGNISGTGSLTMFGATTFTLSGSNTYSGATNVQMGLLKLGSSTALSGNSPLTLGDSSGDAGTVDLAGYNATAGGLSVISPGSGIIGSSGSTAVTLSFVGGTNSSTFSGTIENALSGGTGTLALNVTSGSLTLSGSNAFTGNTTVAGGALSLTTPLLSSNVTVSAGGAFNVLGTTLTNHPNLSLVGSAYFNSANTLNTLNGASTGLLTISGTTLTIANGGSYAGAIANGASAGALNIPTGTLTLSGSSSFSGATNVSTATLIVTGAMSNSSINITNSILAGAGNGTSTGLLGNVTLNSGSIHPGTSPADGTIGTMTMSSLTVNGGDMRFDVSTSANDQINILGSATYQGASTITIAPNLSLATGDYVLLQDSHGFNFGLEDQFNPTLTTTAFGRGTFALNFSNPDEIQLNVVNNPGNLIWNGNANGTTWDTQTGSGATLNWLNTSNDAQDYFYSNDNVTFNDANEGHYNVSIVPAGVNPASVTVNSTGTYTFSGGAIVGNTGLGLSGGGTLVLHNANTFTGNTTISGGSELILSTGGGLTSAIKVGGGTVQTTASTSLGAVTLGDASNDNGTLDIDGSTVTLAGLASAGTGSDIVTNTNSTAGTLIFAGTNSTFGGVIKDGSGKTFLNIQSGSLTLTGIDTFSGNTTIGAATLLSVGGTLTSSANINVNGALTDNGSIAGTNLNLNSGGAATINGLASAPNVTVAGNSLLTVASGGSLTGTNINVTGTLTDSGLVGGNSVSLTVNGSGTLTVSSTGALAASLSLIDNGTATLSNTAQTIASLNGAGSLDLSATTLTVTNGGSYSGVIKDSGMLSLSGGTLTLTNTNTYSGGTNISGGSELVIGTGGSVPGTIKVGGGTLQTTIPTTLASLTLGDSNNDSGVLDLDGSNVTVNGLASLGTGANAITNTNASAGTLTFVDGTSTFGGVIEDGDAQTFLNIQSGSLTLTAIDTYSGNTTIGAATLLNVNGTLTNSANINVNGTLTDNGSIAGTNLNINNGSSATINGLAITPNVTIATSGLMTVATGGSLTGANINVNGTLTDNGLAGGHNGTLTINSTGTLTVSSTGILDSTVNLLNNGTAAVNNPAQTIDSLNGSGSLDISGSTLTIANGGSYTGLISGSGSLAISGGFFSLSGNNTYTGNTYIQGGTLQVGDILATGPQADGSINVSNGGTLDMGGDPFGNNYILSVKPVFISGMGVGGEGAIVNNGSAPQLFAFGFVTLTGNSAIGGTSRWDFRPAGNPPFLNLNGFTLDKVGTNQISMVGSNLENTGATPAFVDVQSGLFSLEAGSNTLGTGTIQYENGINAQFYNTFGTINWAMIFQGNNLIGNASPGLATVESNMTLNAPVTLEPLNGLSGGTPNNNYPLALTGNIGGTGSLTAYGSTTVTFSGSNSYSGGTNVQMGVLQLGSNNALPSGGDLTLGDSSGDTGTLDMAGFNATVGGLSVISPGVGIIGNSSNSGSTLTYAGGVNSSTFTGSIQDSLNGSSGHVAFAVASGSLTLPVANTYSGGTTINGGLLVVANGTGSATGAGNVTMNGGVLASAPTGGTISGNVISGSGAHTIAPGGIGTVGQLNIGGLTSSSFTTLDFDLGAGSGIVTSGDLLVLGSGAVNIGADTNIAFGVDPATSGIDYRLIGGSISSINLANFALPAAPASVAYSLSTSVDPGFIDLVVGTAFVAQTLTWNNTGGTGDGTTWDVNTNQNWSNGAPTTYLDGDNVVFNDTNNGNYTVNITPASVSPGSVTVNTTNTYTITGGGITASAGLEVNGGGTLVLANEYNSFVAPVSIDGGSTLSVGGLLDASVNVNNGTLQANAEETQITGSVTLGDVNNDAGVLDLNGVNLPINAGLNSIGTGANVVGNSSSKSATLVIEGGSSTFGGTIQDTLGTNNGQTVSLLVDQGVFTLTGPNTYTGGTSINSELIVANTTGSATGPGDISLNGILASGATGSVAGNVHGSGTIAPGGIGTVGTLNIGGLTSDNNLILNFDLGAGHGNVTSGDLLVLGGGTVSIGADTNVTFGSDPSTAGVDYRLIGGSISGINLANFNLPTAPTSVTYSLSTSVDPGFIDLVVGYTSPQSLTWNNAGGTGDGTSWDVNTNQNWNDSGNSTTYADGDSVTFNDTNNGNFTVNIVAGGVSPGSMTVNTTNTYTVTGGEINGSAGLTVTGGGTMILNDEDSSFAAPVTINGGSTLVLSGGGILATDVNVQNGTLQTQSDESTIGVVTLGDANNDGGVLDTDGINPQINGLSSVGTGANIVGNSASRSSVIVIVGTNSTTFSGIIQDTLGTNNGQTVGLEFDGAALTLTSANTYSGGTRLDNGTLIVANTNGSATGSGDVTLDGGVLASAPTGGSISGNVLAGIGPHTIAPGGVGTIGRLNIGGLSSSSNTTLNFDLGTGSGIVTSGDLLVLGSGTVDIGADTNVTFGSNPTTAGLDYRLIGGSIGGISLSNFDLPTAPSSVTYSLSTSVDPGFIDLVVGSPGPQTITWNNAGGTGDGKTWDIGVNQNWNNGAPTTYADGDNVNFTDSNNGNYIVNVAAGGVHPGSISVNTSHDYYFNGGPITGSTGLSLTGSGTLILNDQSSSFSQPVVIGGVSELVVAGGGTLSADVDVQAGELVTQSATSNIGVVTLGDANNHIGVVDLDGNDPVFAGLSSIGTGQSFVGNSSSTSATLVINSGNTTFGATIQNILGTNYGQTVGLHIKAASLTLTGVNTFSGGTQIDAAGSLTIGGAGALPAGSIVVNSGTLAIDANSVVGNITGSGSLVVGTNATQATLALSATNGISQQSTLTINNGSAFDLGNNAVLIPDGGNPASVEAIIQQYVDNGIGGSISDGGGSIVSTYGSLNGMLVAYADGSDANMVGTKLANDNPGDIVIEPALAGDTDLNGVVNIHDLQNLLGNFNQPGFWDEGNFNGHAIVDISDLQALLSNFNTSTTLTYSELTGIEGLVGQFGYTAIANPSGTGFTLTAVPEPASMGLMAVASLGLLTRRRRARRS